MTVSRGSPAAERAAGIMVRHSLESMNVAASNRPRVVCVGVWGGDVCVSLSLSLSLSLSVCVCVSVSSVKARKQGLVRRLDRGLEGVPVLQLELRELPRPEPGAVGLGVERRGRVFVREGEEVEREAEARDGDAGDQAHPEPWET